MSGRVVVALILVLCLAQCDDEPKASTPRPVAPGNGDAAAKYQTPSGVSEPNARPGRIQAEPAELRFEADLDAQGKPRESAQLRRIIQLRNIGETNIPSVATLSADPSFAVDSGCLRGIGAGQSCPVSITWTSPSLARTSKLLISYRTLGKTEQIEVPLAGEPVEAPFSSPSPPPDLQSLSRKALEFARLAALEAEDRAAEQEAPVWGRNFPKAESSLPLDRTRIITTDRVINAVLERGVDSSVPGPVVAVVETNVYGADGRLVLIPAGSRIVGSCRALASSGEYRVQIEFERILRPDGAQILIGTPAADAMGRIGIPGELDQRVLDRVGVPLLVSVIGAVSAGLTALSGVGQTQIIGGGGVVTTQTGSTQGRAIALAGAAIGSQFTDFATKLLEERADVRPVVRLAQGARLLIVPTTDMWLNDKGLANAARTAQLQRLRTAEVVDEIEAHSVSR